MATAPRHRLVLIEWVDSYGCSTTWEEIDDPYDPPEGPLICWSVGWLLRDGEDCKVVVPHMADPIRRTGKSQGCGDMTIPASAIVSIVDMGVRRETDADV